MTLAMPIRMGFSLFLEDKVHQTAAWVTESDDRTTIFFTAIEPKNEADHELLHMQIAHRFNKKRSDVICVKARV